MAYKAVFINENHIAHYGYKEDWQGKLHGKDGTYQVKPEWMKANSNFGRTHNQYKYTGAGHSNNSGSSPVNTPPVNTPPANNQPVNTPPANNPPANNPPVNTPPANNTNNTPSPQNPAGPINYKRENPLLLENDDLRERNARGALISQYNKYYPSAAEQWRNGSQQATQLINQGAGFIKRVMPDAQYVPLDLSNMTNEQLREANTRAQLENQYNQYFNPPKQNKSKEWVDIAAQGLGLAINAAGVAVPIIIAARNAKKGG